MSIKLLFFSFIILLSANIKAQIAIGDWRIHSSYINAKKVIDADNSIYCITDGGIYKYNTYDNSTEDFSRIDGLSDVNITTGDYYDGTLILGYDNGNIDIITNNTIYNIPDIKRKEIFGSKSINNIFFFNSFAYLSCGFGIVKLDYKRNEIKDTYFIGENSTQKKVNCFTASSSNFYAATEDGIYRANINSPNLAFYENWEQITDIPNYNSNFKIITFFNNSIYAVQQVGENFDNLYRSVGNSWQRFNPDTAKQYYNIKVNNEQLSICNDGYYTQIDKYDNITKKITEYNSSWSVQKTNIRDVVLKNSTYYFADDDRGIVKVNENSFDFIKPNGPATSNFFKTSIKNGILWGVQGGMSGIWTPQLKKAYAMNFENNVWTNSVITGDWMSDLVDITFDNNDSRKVFIASYSGGVIQMINGKVDTIYTDFDTQTALNPRKQIASISTDSKNNIWVSVRAMNNQFAVKTPDNKWHQLNYSNRTTVDWIDDMIVTKDDYKWVILARVGLFAFDDKGTFDNIDDDDYNIFYILDENGDVVSNEPLCIAEDKDGTIWAGTSKGVVTYFYPKDVFLDKNKNTNISNNKFRGQRVIIEQNGIAQYLLETEEVTAIAISGDNTKWFGTKYSGIYHISADGTEELGHFNTDNSPLLSNNILSISINDITGEIFIGTEKGLISYKGTATEGNDIFKDVYAYPNPVPHDYTGLIAIKGLVTNANVKITDISGNLVYETQAEGGQATWNGRNFSGEKVKTGVYLAFCSDEEGEKTFITKILFIN